MNNFGRNKKPGISIVDENILAKRGKEINLKLN